MCVVKISALGDIREMVHSEVRVLFSAPHKSDPSFFFLTSRLHIFQFSHPMEPAQDAVLGSIILCLPPNPKLPTFLILCIPLVPIPSNPSRGGQPRCRGHVWKTNDMTKFPLASPSDWKA